MDMEWFSALMEQMREWTLELLEWIMNFLDRLSTDTEGIDVLVTSFESRSVFWPVSEEAKRVCTKELAEFPSRWGGYTVGNSDWKSTYDHLDHDCGLAMAVAATLPGGLNVTFIEVHT